MDATAADFGGTQRFEIRRRVGAGGMGVVYEAYDRQHQMRVALKTLPQGSPASLYRFKQEFRNLADVTHPNLAALYELFSVDEHWFFTMEYVDGFNYLDYIRFGPNGPDTIATTLIPNGGDYTTRTPTVQRLMSGLGELFAWENALLANTAPLEGADRFDRLRTTTLQLAEAVRALHAAGKLHRDIKPSNVLVSRRGRTVLLDFGLTMSVRNDADENRVITGTVAYMSPEQAAAEPLLPASDWYAVGAMLYEALTGQFPFHYTADLIVAKRTLDPPRPRDSAPKTPADLDDLCHRLLSRYAEERPAAEEIIERLGGRPSGPVSINTVDEIPLIGRRDHMNELRAALAATRAGKPVAMFVHGASGEGKSFLVNRFLEEIAERQQAVVLTGRCYETESVPYKALDSLVDALGRFLTRKREIAMEVVPRDARLLTRVFPVLREVAALDKAATRIEDNPSDQELRGRASRALRDLIARLGDRVPIVLCIDDLQWGDLDSGGLIAELLAGPDAPVILFIGVYRSEYATKSAILQMLLETPPDRRGAERRFLPVGVLSEVEARVLALELLRTVNTETATLAEIVARESRGVPYFVHELVRFVQSGATITGSLSLEQVLAGRVAALPDAPRRLLETVAVAGQPIRQADAYNAAGLVGEDRASTAFLRAEHLIRSTGTGEDDIVEAYHDRIRETLVTNLDADVRKQHHFRLGDTLERSGGGDAETLAMHFANGGELRKASHYYVAAGDRAADALAFDRAAHLYREALRHRHLGDSQRDDLHVRLGDALANAGRGAEAAEEYRKAIYEAGTVRGIDLRRRAAYQYCISGHIEEGRSAMYDLLARYCGVKLPESRVGVVVSLLRNRFRLWLRSLDFKQRDANEIPAEELMRIDVLWSASAGLSMSDIVLGAALQTYGLIEAMNCGEVYRVARSLAWEATHVSNEGGPSWPRTQRLLDLAQEFAERSNHPHALGMAAMARGIAEFTSGRWATAVPQLDHADDLLRQRCTNVAWELDTAHAFALWALIYKGDFAEMRRRSLALIKEAEDRGDLYAYATLGTFHHPHAILAADDDVTAARDFLDHSRSKWVTSGFYLQDIDGLMCDALIDTYENNGARGYERFLAFGGKVKASQLLRSQCIALLYYHFRARAALNGAINGRSDLIRAAEADAKRIDAQKVEWAKPYGSLIHAGVALARGDAILARALLRESAEMLDRVNMFSHAASARLVLGEMTGGAEGEALQHQAHEFFAGQGIKNARAMARLHMGAVA